MTFSLNQILQAALLEDCPGADLTTDLCLNQSESGRECSAHIISKSDGVFYGTEVVETLFSVMKQPVRLTWQKKNGEAVLPQTLIGQIEGAESAILKAERLFLNIVQHLSGIASTTRQFVQALDNPDIAIVDTRKTTPLFRDLEKKAVLAGGGVNHRHGLSDMVIFKENHLRILERQGRLSDLGTIIDRFKHQRPDVQVEVEVESLDQLKGFDLEQADIIMLDNFPVDHLASAIQCCGEKGYHAEIEVSGNVTLDNIHAYRRFPIHRIAVGRLTHSVKGLDLTLQLL